MHNIELTYEERSTSKQILDRLVYVAHPQSYETYMNISSWARTIDNLVDEGESYCVARAVLDRQQEVLALIDNDLKVEPRSLESGLLHVLHKTPPHLLADVKNRIGEVISYFSVDLEHRKTMTAFEPSDLSKHIVGGYIAVFDLGKMITTGKSIHSDGYLQLVTTHGKLEPLGDLAEDLEHGFLPHDITQVEDWVSQLQVGKEVPYQAIDAYVVRQREKLARDIIYLAPHAFFEFKNTIGLLQTVDYIRRGFQLAKQRFMPREKVIFARYHFKD